MNIRKLATALAAAGLLLPPAAVATDGYFSHGYFMKAKGRGGASMGFSDDTSGGANNPASLAFVGNRLDAGVDFFAPRREASRSGSGPANIDGSIGSESNLFAIPEFGYNFVLNPETTVGVTVYGNGGLSALAFIDPEARLDAFEAMFLLAVMIGIVQIAIAVLKLGDLTRYISESVVTGFIVGAATLTIIGQIANALGVKSQGTGHQHVLYRLWLTLTQQASINPKALTISIGAIVLALLSRQLVRRLKLPQLDMFFVLIFVTFAAWLAGWSEHGGGVKPAVSLIEAVPASLPLPHIPEIKWHWIGDLSGSAVAIAVLGLLEALAIAKAIAHKSGQQLDYNRLSRAFELSGSVTRDLSGRHSARKGASYEADKVATGDSDDEIRRGV